MPTQTDVIIIGAGAAGLAAAKELTQQPSTVVDTTVAPFRVLREGSLAKSLVQAALVETFIELVPE